MTHSEQERARAKRAQEFSAALSDMLQNWPMQLELIAYQAKETRARYHAYVKEGFTEAQAIELCKGVK